MSKIIVVSAVFPPEPVVSATLSKDIAEELSKSNLVTVLCPKPTRPHGFVFENYIDSSNYKIIRLNSFTCSESKLFGRLRESYSFGKRSFKYIAENNKDIDGIYANTWPLFAQYFTVKAARKFKIPVIIHVQDVYPESLSNKAPFISAVLNFILLPIDKYILGNATKTIAISDKMKNYIGSTRGIKLNKIEVVQNWQTEEAFIDFNNLNASILNNSTPFTFMYLGNIGPVAGIELLIEAFVKADLKNCRLVIAGSGSKKKSLQEKVEELKLTTIVFWSVADGKVPEIQSEANVMLLPIKKGAAASSIPSKLPAYMFSKRPIIACVDEDSDTARVIKKSNSGWVLPPEDIQSLSDKMKSVTEIPTDMLLSYGTSGFDYALENLSKRNNLKKVIRCINDTIKT